MQAKGGRRRSSSSSRVVNSDKKRDEDEDSEAERDRAERERVVLVGKRATLDARIIVQAAEVHALDFDFHSKFMCCCYKYLMCVFSFSFFGWEIGVFLLTEARQVSSLERSDRRRVLEACSFR